LHSNNEQIIEEGSEKDSKSDNDNSNDEDDEDDDDGDSAKSNSCAKNTKNTKNNSGGATNKDKNEKLFLDTFLPDSANAKRLIQTYQNEIK
jgi:hypothetical protein